MCRCTPEMRTPFCDKPGCEWPETPLSATFRRLFEEATATVDRRDYYDARAKAIAREMCKRAGHDPDLVTMGTPGQPPMLGAKGTIALTMPIRPQWTLFYGDALAAIELVEGAEVARVAA